MIKGYIRHCSRGDTVHEHRIAVKVQRSTWRTKKAHFCCMVEGYSTTSCFTVILRAVHRPILIHTEKITWSDKVAPSPVLTPRMGQTQDKAPKHESLREILNSKFIPRQLKDRKHIQNRVPNAGFQLDQLADSLSIYLQFPLFLTPLKVRSNNATSSAPWMLHFEGARLLRYSFHMNIRVEYAREEWVVWHNRP